MMEYQVPARTFCAKFHGVASSRAQYPAYDDPKDRTTRKALTILTALCSSCAPSHHNVIAAAFCFDATGRPRIVFAGDTGVPAESAAFLYTLVECLRNLSQGPQLSDPQYRDAAIVDIATKIFEFQAQRWKERLYDTPENQTRWDIRLNAIHAELRPTFVDSLNRILAALESIKAHARDLFSRSTSFPDGVQSMVRQLMEFDRVLRTGLDMLSSVDRDVHAPEVACLLDPLHVLPSDDPSCLEDEHGLLSQDFSLARYCVSLVAIVRHATQLVNFAAKDRRVFSGANPKLYFLDQQVAVEDVGGVAREVRPPDDPLHAGMRILQAMLELSEELEFIPAVGSSAFLCPACHACISMLYDIWSLPNKVPCHLYCLGTIRNEFALHAKLRLLALERKQDE